MQKGPFHILLLSGSPDTTSACSRLLHYIKGNADPQLVVLDSGALPLPVFTGSIAAETTQLLQPLFTALKQADAVLLANPEHNGSISTYLKNVLDHTSIPYGCNHWLAKPVGVICCADHSQQSGSARDDLLRLLHCIGADVSTADTMSVGRARTLFDAKGALVDPAVKNQLHQLIKQLTAKISARMAIRHQPPDSGIPLWNSWY